MTATVDQSALLPCRFCGGKAKCNQLRRGNYRRTGDNYQVVCNKCRARGPLIQDDPRDAVAEWNTRTPRPVDQSAVEAAAKAHCDFFGGEGWWDTGLIADTKPKAIEAMRAAIAAMPTDPLVGELVAALEDAANEIRDLRDYANSHGGMIDEEDPSELRALITRARKSGGEAS